MASKASVKVPAGYLEWGTVHTVNPDLGTLMHVAQSGAHVYTGTTKGARWEIRKWSAESMQCGLALGVASCRTSSACKLANPAVALFAASLNRSTSVHSVPCVRVTGPRCACMA